MKRTSESHAAPHLIERQMLLSQVRDKAGRDPSEAVSSPGCRFLTIARTMGSLGDEVAAELAERLQWHMFDREIVDAIALNSHVRRDRVHDLDERSQSLIYDTVARLLSMTEGVSFGNEEYHESLLKTLSFIASRGRSIIVGRGSACALQGEPGLHLRFVATQEVRIRRIMQQRRLSAEEARRLIEKTDGERRNFVQQHFRQSVDNLHFYDAVFNTDHMSVEMIVLAIEQMVKEYQPEKKDQETGLKIDAPPPLPASPPFLGR
jgi:cytidylate kinase